ncbi:hypothetical protein [Bradyrhizobium jicamae]|nr:hypothetical protein [Bradyrhizobium jicamae]
MEVQVRYPTLTEKLARSSIPCPTITADHMLAAARRHAKYLRTVSPREYQMRVFEDGSVFFRNTEIPGLEKLFSLAEIQKAAREVFWLDRHRALWQHIAALWL